MHHSAHFLTSEFQDSYKTNFHQTLFYTGRIKNRLRPNNTQLLGIKGSKIPKDQPTESQTDQIQLTDPWPLSTFFNPIEVQFSTYFCTLCTLVFDDVYLYWFLFLCSLLWKLAKLACLVYGTSLGLIKLIANVPKLRGEQVLLSKSVNFKAVKPIQEYFL